MYKPRTEGCDSKTQPDNFRNLWRENIPLLKHFKLLVGVSAANSSKKRERKTVPYETQIFSFHRVHFGCATKREVPLKSTFKIKKPRSGRSRVRKLYLGEEAKRHTRISGPNDTYGIWHNG